jgi:UDP-N-acetylglucosamine 2-epimerase
MRILIVGEGGRPHALGGVLEAAGMDVERGPEGALANARGDQVGELAGALLSFDRLLSDDPPNGVLLVSASNLALAAALVAGKRQIPVAILGEEAPEGRAFDLNRRLVEQLADRTVADDRAAIASALRDLIAA